MTEERARLPGAERAPESLGGLAATHRPEAVRMARAILRDPDEAEDVAQEMLVRLSAALPGFRGDADLSAWVYRVTLNLCRDQLRRRRRRARDVSIDEAREGELPSAAPPDSDADLERARDAVAEAMNRLPDEQREVLILRYVTGLPYAEIARVTATAPGTIASRVFRALKRLGEQLDPRHLEVLP